MFSVYVKRKLRTHQILMYLQISSLSYNRALQIVTYMTKLYFVLFRAGNVFAGSALRSLTINPENNYYEYLAVHLKAFHLLVKLTLIVSSGPFSSPTCGRAGTPAGPVRTDKIVSCSHV